MTMQTISTDEDGRAVASLTYKPVSSAYAGGEVCLIDKIYVREDRRRQGLGSGIVRKLLSIEPRRIFAKVLKDEEQNVEFFKKCGFVVNGEFETIILMEYKG